MLDGRGHHPGLIPIPQKNAETEHAAEMIPGMIPAINSLPIDCFGNNPRR